MAIIAAHTLNPLIYISQTRIIHLLRIWASRDILSTISCDVGGSPCLYLIDLNHNHHMLCFCPGQVPQVDFWVVPVIQGFVQVEELVVNYNESSDEEKSSPDTPHQELTCVDNIHPRFTVALISRRSRHRAGALPIAHFNLHILIYCKHTLVCVFSTAFLEMLCKVRSMSEET